MASDNPTTGWRSVSNWPRWLCRIMFSGLIYPLWGPAALNRNKRRNPTRKHPLEEDVTLSDGTVVRVTGLYAVQFRKDPTATLAIIEEDYRRSRPNLKQAGKSP